jgi:hypothetical protein
MFELMNLGMNMNFEIDNSKLKISFCTVCMNRLHHLKITLPQNIKDNLDYGNIEFILLDYNSDDGLQEWVLDELHEHLKSGKVKFFRTEDPQYFHRCHSRNMAFKKASGQIICNVDADNYIGPSFAQYINDFFQSNLNSFLTPDYTVRDSMGRVCIKKSDYHNIRGYNERLEGYGFDDLDLYRRLELMGINHAYIKSPEFLSVINHDNADRYKNEYMGKNLLHIYISYLSPYKSELIFLFRNEYYDWGTIIDNEMLTADNDIKTEDDNQIILSGVWKKGTWKRINDDIIVTYQSKTKVLKKHGDFSYQINSKLYYEIHEKNLFEEILLMRTDLDNRNKCFQYERDIEKKVMNSNGYGMGHVMEFKI